MNVTLEFLFNEPTPTIEFTAPLFTTYPEFSVAELESGQEDKKLPFTSKITKTTFTGLVIIKFSAELNPIPLVNITNSHISMNLLINDERDDIDDKKFDYSQLNFTWEAVY